MDMTTNINPALTPYGASYGGPGTTAYASPGWSTGAYSLSGGGFGSGSIGTPAPMAPASYAPVPGATAASVPQTAGYPTAPTAAPLDAFTAPDPNNFTKDPSYQFRLSQGLNALQNSAAARGTLLTGATLKGENDYAAGSASQEYQNAYNRALQTYDTNRDTSQLNFGNANTSFQGNLASIGDSNNMALARNAQAMEAQAAAQQQNNYADATNYSRSQYANQTAYDRALTANDTTYNRARTAWQDAGGYGPLYGGYMQPGAPPNYAKPYALASSAPPQLINVGGAWVPAGSAPYSKPIAAWR